MTDHMIDPTDDRSMEPVATSPTLGPTTFHTRTGGAELLRIGAVVLAGLAIIVTAAVATGAARNSGPSTVLGAGASTAPSAAPSDKLRDRGRMGPGMDGWAKGGVPWMAGRGLLGQGFGQITISAIDGTALSLKTDDGWTRTITVTSSTTVTKGGAAAKLADLAVGDTVRFRETRNSDGSFTITAIEVILPRTVGTISNVSGTTFTLTDRDGAAWTVTLSDATKYWLGNQAGSRSDVKVGMTARVVGSTSTGNAIAATQVAVQVPRIVGEVTTRQGNTITIQTRAGDKVTIHVTSATTYHVNRNDAAKLTDVAVGMTIIVAGTKRGDGSFDALSVAGGMTLHGPIKVPPLRPNASPASGTQG